MESHRTVRAIAALLMLLGLLLPVATPPALAIVPGAVPAPSGPVYNAADCQGTFANLSARYFATIRSTTGTPITNSAAKLIYNPTLTLPAPTVLVPGAVAVIPSLPLPAGVAPVQNLQPGDLEGQATDGSPDLTNACAGAGAPDGIGNDVASQPLPSIPTAPQGVVGVPPANAGISWTLIVTANGFVPVTIPLVNPGPVLGAGQAPSVIPVTDGAPFPPGIGVLSPFTGIVGCPASNPASPGLPTPNDAFGCNIGLGPVDLAPLTAVAGRGTVAGSVFLPTGFPENGSTITLRDASGNVHTRTTGSNCVNPAFPAAGAPGAGFFCFDDASSDTAAGLPGAEDGLGLPPGPAVLTVVDNTGANCPDPDGAGPILAGAPGTICGVLPATVTVNVAAGVVTGQDITFQNAQAPVFVPAGAGAYGYIVNDIGQGVGGVGITATSGGLATGTNCSAGAPVGPVFSSPQTGLWSMCGLPALSAVTFTVLNANNPQLAAANVRPAGAIVLAGGTGPVGTYRDPNWIIVNSPGPSGVTLPIVGSTVIRGQVLDSQGQPFNGVGAFVVLYRNGNRDIAQGTFWAGTLPTINPRAGLGFIPFSNNVIFTAAAALDAGGNYCFGAAPVIVGSTSAQCTGGPLVPDEYIVTVIDDRAVFCQSGFQPPPGGIGPAPCGQLPQTSQPVIAQSDRIATVNFSLQARFSPGSNPLATCFGALPGACTGAPGAPFVGVVNPGGTTGVFGFLWDLGVPGGRPIQGATVYAVPVPAGVTAPAATVASAAPFLNFVAQVPLTGLGVLGGAVQTSNPPPVAVGIPFPTYPGSDPFGMYRIVGLAPGIAYAVIIEVPQGYTNCAPFNVQVGTPNLGYPFGQTGILNPTGITRCGLFITTPTAAQTLGPDGVAGTADDRPWVAGADFGLAPQLLRPVEPGEIDRRLEHILPLIANGAPTAPLGGWDVNTTEIHVTNAGAQRTIAEVRFYASDGLGGAGVLAGTATADLMPGGKRVFRGAEIPGGFLGWAGVWAFDADGPGGVYGASSLVATRTVAIRNADNAMETIPGITREEVASPQQDTLVPVAFKNYGGSGNLWSSLISVTNIGDSAPVVFSFRQAERVRGDARSCQPCLITRYSNRGGLVTLNLGDENDPETALLGDGVYSMNVQAGGPLVPSAVRGIVPGATLVNNLPGGHVAEVLNVSLSGKMVTKSRAQQRLGLTTFDVEQFGMQYAPLLFNNYNGWMSAIAFSTGQDSGGTSGNVTVTFFDEGGGFVGEYSDRISQSGQPLLVYLPALPFLPEGFRGTAVVNATASSGNFPGLAPSLAMAGMVQHVNYDRNQAMSYNLIGAGAITHRTEALGEIPCISLGFTTCAWAADVSKTGAVTAEGGLGMNTGIRIFNPDPPQLGTGVPLGIPARVVVQYIDGAGVMWNDATQQFQIPPFGVHSLFPAYDRRLPDAFRGTVRIMSTGNAIVAVANNVDYNVTGRDASGAYNLQYHTGRTD